jgi:hypothetical protein
MFDVGQWQTPTRWRPRRRDFLVGEVDAVGEPDAIAEPAAFLEVVDRPAGEMLEAVFVLVLGLAEVGVQAAIVLLGEADAVDHQPLGHGERRARRQRHLQHRALAGVVIAAEHALAIGEDGVLVLDDAVGRQAAVLLRQIHRAAGERHADADARGLLGLDVHRVFEAAG